MFTKNLVPNLKSLSMVVWSSSMGGTVCPCLLWSLTKSTKLSCEGWRTWSTLVNLGYLHRCCAGPIHWTVKSDQSLSAPNLKAQGVKPTADSADAQQSVGVGVLGWLGMGAGRIWEGQKGRKTVRCSDGAARCWNDLKYDFIKHVSFWPIKGSLCAGTKECLLFCHRSFLLIWLISDSFSLLRKACSPLKLILPFEVCFAFEASSLWIWPRGASWVWPLQFLGFSVLECASCSLNMQCMQIKLSNTALKRCYKTPWDKTFCCNVDGSGLRDFDSEFCPVDLYDCNQLLLNLALRRPIRV